MNDANTGMIMRLLRKRYLTGVTLGIALGLATTLLPDISVARDGHHDTARSNSTSLEHAVANIQDRTGGRVLRARHKGSKYIIKVLMPSGVVRTFRVNARDH